MTRVHRRTTSLIALALSASLLAAACGDDDSASETTTAAQDEGSTSVDDVVDETVTIGLVRQIAAGDYFEQWEEGAKAEADRLGIELQIFNAGGDNAQQALDFESALNAGVDAIAVDHGVPETMQPAIALALEAGVPTVAFDVDPGDPSVPEIFQSDDLLAQLALDQMIADIGGEGDVLYVYVAGFAPLDRRNEVWLTVKDENPGINEVAQIGAVNDSIVSTVADQAKAALQANPDTVAVFAPFDEFAKGATLAIEELGLQDQVKVYGADISTADIAVMTAEGSPWVATATTDPSNVGRVTIRAAYLAAIGGELPNPILIPPLLVTQDDLRESGVTDMAGLVEAFPLLETADLIPAG